MKIKYWDASGSGFPPSLIPALKNIGILHHKKAKLPNHLQQSVYVQIQESRATIIIDLVKQNWS